MEAAAVSPPLASWSLTFNFCSFFHPRPSLAASCQPLCLPFFLLLPANNSPSSISTFSSNLLASLPPPTPHPSPLSFLHRKHFQGWHTRGDGCTENSATTIMSTLTSHNNTRINLPEEEGGGRSLGTCRPWMECQHFTDLYLWKCEIWS